MPAATWVEISTSALVANLEALQRHARTPVCAVVKANGYGHGLVGAARAFARGGAAMLAVTRVEEARALRDAGIEAPVLIMTPALDPSEAVALDCALTVGAAEEIAVLPHDARVHLKIDTGMGRLGVEPSAALDAARAIAARATLAGVWTHLADAAGQSGRAQLLRFRAVLGALRAEGFAATAHAANSAAAIALPDAHLDMVRAGTILYGQSPPGVRAPFPLADGFAWYCRAVTVRTLPAGATVGYGSEWRASRPVRVATLPIGYADGFLLEPEARTPSPREAARRIKRLARGAAAARRVYFDDRPAPVVGRVAMQATTVAVDHLPHVTVGSVARIPGRRLLVSPAIERVYA